jgi:hypothetical protein
MSLPHKLPCLVLCLVIHLLLSARVSASGMKEMNPPAADDETKITALVGGRLIDGRGGVPVEDGVVVIRGLALHAK